VRQHLGIDRDRWPDPAGIGLRARLRQRVPAPVRRADAALFRAVAQRRLPVLGPMLTRLSRAANRSRLWLVIGAVLATVAGRDGRRAA
jgi:hypothetical protein